MGTGGMWGQAPRPLPHCIPPPRCSPCAPVGNPCLNPEGFCRRRAFILPSACSQTRFFVPVSRSLLEFKQFARLSGIWTGGGGRRGIYDKTRCWQGGPAVAPGGAHLLAECSRKMHWVQPGPTSSMARFVNWFGFISLRADLICEFKTGLAVLNSPGLGQFCEMCLLGRWGGTCLWPLSGIF